MKVVLQRVSGASVAIGGETVGEIGPGMVLLVGIAEGDDEEAVEWVADKVAGLRIFADDEGKMNRSLGEVAGDLLVISQFTLCGDVTRGRRPSFVDAASPEVAEALYDRFVERLEAVAPGRVETGEFGAMMDVSLVNDGPVTFVVER